MKYYKNKAKRDCGPVVIMNAKIWAGEPVQYYKELKNMRKTLRYNPRKGTHIDKIEQYLERKRLPFHWHKTKLNPTKATIRLALKKKHAVILWQAGLTGAHISLITKMNDKNITIHNISNAATHKMSWSTLNDLLECFYCVAYIIKKKDSK